MRKGAAAHLATTAREAAVRRPSASATILRRARDAALERTAIGGCLVLAAVCGGWAAVSIAGSPNGYDVREIVPPIANGFAWKKSVSPVRTAAVDLDPLTTGSLPDRAVPAAAEAGATPLAAVSGRPYVLRRVGDGTALVEGPSGLRQIVPGAVLPGAGRVISIRQTGAGWVVVTSETIIGPTPL
ncbi:hypothetical protein ASG40_02900 [Methylobacterium sp. Leaf399]|nr:hypothetical protein ASF39_02890 [Methylobacterium sp. Leaf108]KQT19783.1 hypothetical protein ASG40_02900 [Methylobacterium sp. Leaf399]KQT80833.1 hypothetical protein ASG59_05325 [Methylobacterium sp. Leaf466]